MRAGGAPALPTGPRARAACGADRPGALSPTLFHCGALLSFAVSAAWSAQTQEQQTRRDQADADQTLWAQTFAKQQHAEQRSGQRLSQVERGRRRRRKASKSACDERV